MVKLGGYKGLQGCAENFGLKHSLVNLNSQFLKHLSANIKLEFSLQCEGVIRVFILLIFFSSQKSQDKNSLSYRIRMNQDENGKKPGRETRMDENEWSLYRWHWVDFANSSMIRMKLVQRFFEKNNRAVRTIRFQPFTILTSWSDRNSLNVQKCKWDNRQLIFVFDSPLIRSLSLRCALLSMGVKLCSLKEIVWIYYTSVVNIFITYAIYMFDSPLSKFWRIESK